MREELLSIVFPNRCAYCGELIPAKEKTCNVCKTSLPSIEGPVCLSCGHSKADCTCRHQRAEYKAVIAPFYYASAIKTAIHRLKFKGIEGIAKTLSRDMYTVVQKNYKDINFDLITFVPFSKREKRTRPFNQSEVLASNLSNYLGVSNVPTLQKLYDIQPQHTLRQKDRIGNVFGAFDVIDKDKLKGKTILLVDDIKTTGATLSECAKMLNLAGAKAVYAVTAAITKNFR